MVAAGSPTPGAPGVVGPRRVARTGGGTAPAASDGPPVINGPVHDAVPLPSNSPYALPDQTTPSTGPGHG